MRESTVVGYVKCKFDFNVGAPYSWFAYDSSGLVFFDLHRHHGTENNNNVENMSNKRIPTCKLSYTMVGLYYTVSSDTDIHSPAFKYSYKDGQILDALRSVNHEGPYQGEIKRTATTSKF